MDNIYKNRNIETLTTIEFLRLMRKPEEMQRVILNKINSIEKIQYSMSRKSLVFGEIKSAKYKYRNPEGSIAK